jgi:cellulose synthase/poly-beta-1,6-N-acetylglucosamine synthase-like glycosyltransferase
MEILDEHSGRHNGDDLESTAIALRKGYGVVYDPPVVVRTSVPQSARALYKQRKRWELGSLETYGKEKSFYFSQVKNLKSRLGHVTLLDWYGWATVVLVPLYTFNWLFHPVLAAMWASVQLLLTLALGYVSRDEFRTRNELFLIPLFPIYQFFAMMPRLVALYEFARPADRSLAVGTP